MAWIQDILDTLYAPNTVCVACISYGKDSLAMLRAIKLLGLPLHRIVHTEVWATKDIPADLPPMVEFKAHADKIIKDLYGISVEHICATKPSQSVHVERERETFDDVFYRRLKRGKFAGTIKGFPQTIGGWCHKLKYEGTADIRRYILSTVQGRKEGRKEGTVYGFATHHNTYCRGELKNIRIPDSTRKLVSVKPQTILTGFRSPSDGGNGVNGSSSFPTAPRMRGGT